MITVFNRVELFTTFDLSEQARVRDILATNGIDYKIKTVDAVSRAYPSYGIGRKNSFSINDQARVQYYIYIKSSDYDKAKQLI